MSCFLEENEGKVNAVLMFKRSQLLYDIENYAHIEGSVMDTDKAHNRHMVQDVGQDGNVDRMTRVLDVGVARCREMLYAYTKHGVHRPELDDVLKEPDVYGIVMSVPKEFSQTTLNLLEKLIHEHLVCMGVADWMSITNPDKEQTWKAKAEEAEREINGCVLTRMGRVRRRGHPF